MAAQTKSRSPSPLPPSADDPSPPTTTTKAAKRSNPLVDLIESEKEYVDLLAGIIRKVASAWSRTNFPPPELDTMFRGIEAVYRANRSLLSKLKEIGPNPSSPKALGDLLMRWIDDLDAPYTRYCSTYTTSFNDWDPVQSNPNLQPLLEQITASHSPPANSSSAVWTLDALFALPKLRLKYYKKLYSRLLKSTQPGRSDHKLLVGANERLDALMEQVLQRMEIRVGRSDDTPAPPPPPPKAKTTPDPSTFKPLPEVSKPLPEPADSLPPLPHIRERKPTADSGERVSQASSIDSSRLPGSSVSSGSDRFSRDTAERFSRETGATSISAGRSPSAMSATHPSPEINPDVARASILELETRLDTTRVLDIFTMKPKPCKLQMSKPNPAAPLSFVRAIRFEADVVISFVPKSTESEVVYKTGYMVMLTDLFLICERMGRGAVSGNEEPSDGQDLWLCFPPLAARHLKVVEDSSTQSSTTFSVQVMKKETLTIHCESREMKDQLVEDFTAASENAATLAPPPRAAPTALSPNQSQHASPLGSSQSMSPPRGNGGMGGDVPPMSLPERDARGLATNAPRMAQSYHDPPDTHSFNSALSPRNSESAVLQQFNRGDFGPEQRMGPGPDGRFGPPPRGGPGGSFSPPFPPQHQGPPFHQQPQFSAPQPQRPNMPPFPQSAPLHGQFPPNMGDYPPPRGIQDPNGMRRASPGPGGMPFPPGPNGQPGPHPHMLRKSPSGRSLGTRSAASSMYQDDGSLPPIPGMPPRGPGGPFPNGNGFGPPPGRGPPPLNIPPAGDFDPNAPDSPMDEEPKHTGPVTSTITAQMKCKVFLQQQHAQWKSLGGAKLKIYEQQPTNVKQLVVEADTKNKTMLISTIVMADGVERVGRTGVAIELSDQGARTGIVYMIQMKNETSASGLFDTLLAGSDRSAVGAAK